MGLDLDKIEFLIFDLDDTLFDTYGQLVKPAAEESCKAMIAAGLNATLGKCLETRDRIQKNHPRKDLYEQIVTHFGVKFPSLPKNVARAGMSAFHDRKIKEAIELFPDAESTLEVLAEKFKLYLVTMGAPQTQKEKIRLLRLDSYFKEIFVVNNDVEQSKKAAFTKIMEQTKSPPQTHLCIGNRVDLEIRDAKELGMQTILFCHGEYAHLSPLKSEHPDFQIDKLGQLVGLLVNEG